MRGVGIITAMRVEARCITQRRLPFNKPVTLGDNAVIQLSGWGADAARKAAEELKTSGATALVSFGFAGALEPRLIPGDLVLPEFIHAGRLLAVDLGWRDSFRQRLPAHLSIAGGVLAASAHVLTSGAAKREFALATGACAVDMESGAIAEAAAHASIPFLAIRAISDPVDFSPPPVLIGAVRPDGSAELMRLLPLLLRRALTLGTLLRLATGSRAACSTLSLVARFGGMEMGIAPRRSASSLARF